MLRIILMLAGVGCLSIVGLALTHLQNNQVEKMLDKVLGKEIDINDIDE